MPPEHALGEFYDRHGRALWAYVYRVTGNAADADDIVQEAFLRLFQSERLPDDGDELRRYVFRVAGNLMTDRWRRRVREERRIAGPRGAARPQERDIDVVRTFEALKPRERALLWLAYIEGHPHADIAASLHLARDSVKVLLARARGRLRGLLKERGLIEEAGE